MGEGAIKLRQFQQLDLEDPFFDSLKKSYLEFEEWFKKKAQEYCYIVFDDAGKLQGFLYTKAEKGPILDITPPLNADKVLKVGTFKINAHGTKLGERFVKIIMDLTLAQGIRHAYVTVFKKHEPLIAILTEYGFKKWGHKESPNGTEEVYVKDLTTPTNNILLDYPVVDTRGRKKWLLAIYPEFHSVLFPDSILSNEKPSIIQDVSFTNSIHKAYLGFMRDFKNIKPGDCIVIYKCNAPDSDKAAWFRSVATSLCVIQEVRAKSTFKSEQDLVDYCRKYSVFNESKLRKMYNTKKYYELHTLKMTYNIAFPKRPTLKDLVEKAGLPQPNPGIYYGLLSLTDAQFKKILEMGQVYEGSAFN